MSLFSPNRQSCVISCVAEPLVQDNLGNLNAIQLHPYFAQRLLRASAVPSNILWSCFACFYKLGPLFLYSDIVWDISSFLTFHMSILSNEPLQIPIHPSIHLPWIHLHKKMSCKYFGVECRCVSPLPVAHQPQSNRLCLFVQLKLFVPCFPWCARLYSLIKCHTFSFSPPSSFFVCVSWKQR